MSTKKHGGLGIKNVFTFNQALLAKWRWELMMVIEVYGVRWWSQGWRGLQLDGVNKKSSIWSRNLYIVCGGQSSSKWFDISVEWKEGKGDKILF